MDLETIDLYIMLTLSESSLTNKELSNFLMTDQSIVFKELKRLKAHNLIITDNNRPKKYYLNKTKFQKWKKKN